MVSEAASAADDGGFDLIESIKRAISERKQRANRRNAKKSTGPQSEEGKKRSSRNSITHGLYCQDVLLSGEDERLFERMHNALVADLSPQNLFELSLVGQIMAAQWRMLRCQRAEVAAIEMHAMKMQDFSRQRFSKLMARFGFEPQQVHDDQFMKNEEEMTEDDLAHLLKLRLLDAGSETDLPPELNLASLFTHAEAAERNVIERFSRYEQRQQQTILRCMRELERLRSKARSHWNDLPASPFLQPIELADDEDDEDEEMDEEAMSENVAEEQEEQNEATDATNNASGDKATTSDDLKEAEGPDDPPTSSSPGNPGEAG